MKLGGADKEHHSHVWPVMRCNTIHTNLSILTHRNKNRQDNNDPAIETTATTNNTPVPFSANVKLTIIKDKSGVGSLHENKCHPRVNGKFLVIFIHRYEYNGIKMTKYLYSIIN